MSNREETLCEKAQLGDAAAAGELVSLHYVRIFSYLRRLCGSDADAEDLTQKTFARVWGALPTYAGRSSFSTWAHGIARNVYVDWRRKGNRLDSRTEDWWAGCEEEGPGPFENAMEREEAKRLYALVEKLGDDAREAVHLHYYQGLSLKETAEILNLAPSTLKYRLKEAVGVLRSGMGK
jgi:RNA polymerase sigma-70 factor (ECF subfamily)